MIKKKNVLEKCRINLDKEKVLHSITRVQRDKYKERIDKAIEYIENHNKLEKELGGTIRFDIVKLSNILKGDEK